MPEASLTRALLPELVAQRGWTLLDEKQVVCPIIQLPTTFDDYVQSLDKKERHELRRKLRRGEATEGVTWYAITGPDHTHNLDEAAEAFITLMMKSRSDKSDFMTDDMRRFFHQMIHATHAGGFLHLAFLEVDGVKAATYLSFDYNQKRLVFNSGLETEGFQSLSAGIVLAARIIDEAIQLGYSEFDFLRGDEKYKYQLGAKDTWIYHVRDGSIGSMKPIKRVAMLSVHTCPLAMLGGKETGGMNVYVRDLSRELVRRGHCGGCVYAIAELALAACHAPSGTAGPRHSHPDRPGRALRQKQSL